MRTAIGWMRSGGLALSSFCLLLTAGQTCRADDADTIQAIVETFARAAIHRGVTPGVGIGVVHNSRLYAWAFGYADIDSETPFYTDSIFEIASNTKVFTTNLLGQAVFEKRLKLSDSLSQFHRELGTFKVPLTGKVTLEELGDFTSGFPDYAPLCPGVVGCLPSARPPISQYSAHDFVDFFLNTTPSSSTLPAPYLYSDFSLGLLGLMLGTPPGQRVSDNSLNIWFSEVHSRILQPLGMVSTYLYAPAGVPQARIAKGYSPALASIDSAQVSEPEGQITGITVLDGGGAYSSPPSVTISGGGGSGAAAAAMLDGGTVRQIIVTHGGSGYIPSPTAVTTGGGATSIAKLLPIVGGGQVKAVEVVDGGSGYQKVPAVVITGGLDPADPNAKNATAIAHIANGRVTSVTVSNGGAGYLAPLIVTVAPGNPESNVVPIWAPAGSLLSTVKDLTFFAAAALAGKTGMPGLPAALAAGFRTAETAYACAAQNPDLSSCPPGASRSGLAWAIIPADGANASPEVVTKNGGLPGFSSQIFLVPEREVAIVVLANAETNGTHSETLGKAYPLAAAAAQVLAYNIGYGLINALPH